MTITLLLTTRMKNKPRDKMLEQYNNKSNNIIIYSKTIIISIIINNSEYKFVAAVTSKCTCFNYKI